MASRLRTLPQRQARGRHLAWILLSAGMGRELHQLYGLAMTDGDDVEQPLHTAYDQPIVWRSRYGGLVAIAYLGEKAIAGLSGPWDGKFALTWWDRPMPARQLELCDSLDEGKREVEDWALRMRNGHALPMQRETPAPALPAILVASNAAATAAAGHTTLIERMFNLLPAVAKPRESAADAIERLRRERSEGDDGLADLHFSARR